MAPDILPSLLYYNTHLFEIEGPKPIFTNRFQLYSSLSPHLTISLSPPDSCEEHSPNGELVTDIVIYVLFPYKVMNFYAVTTVLTQ